MRGQVSRGSLARIRQMNGQESRGSAGEYQADEQAGVAPELNSKEAVVDKGEEINTLPTIKITCPECGYNTAGWWLRQTRSADEAETRFYKCLDCGHTWREYD